MTHLRCPLCNLLRHIESFNPEDYVNDIILVEMKSLGWRKGFKVVDEYSALGDETITGRIADRLHLLLQLIEGDKKRPLEVENTKLEDQVEELEDDIKVLLPEMEAAKERIRELEKESEGYGELLSMVNEALEHAYDEPFYDLCSAVEALIGEFDDLLEEAEDES